MFDCENIKPFYTFNDQPAEDEEVSISITIEANSDSLGGSGDFAILELQSL